jgi:hypothetical protein
MFFNLGIEKTDNQTIRLYTEGENTSPEFSSLTDFVSHFTTELLSFQHRDRVIEVYLKPILPPNQIENTIPSQMYRILSVEINKTDSFSKELLFSKKINLNKLKMKQQKPIKKCYL